MIFEDLQQDATCNLPGSANKKNILQLLENLLEANANGFDENGSLENSRWDRGCSK